MRKPLLILLIGLVICGPLNFVGEAFGHNISADSSRNTQITKPFTNPIANNSVEKVNPDNSSIPEAWSHNSWGNNITTFSYLNEGYSGKRSIMIEVNDYVDGDAKWFFNPLKLEPGKDYYFLNYYRSNVDTRIVLSITKEYGNVQYMDLPIVPASSEWDKYEATFTIPKHTKSITVYHLLSQNGYLITDDYFISPYSYEGFKRGLVTLTFDDGWEENIHTALPIMQRFGYKSNQFYATKFIEDPWVSNPKTVIKAFLDDGHELGSHSITHPYLTILSTKDVTNELYNSKTYLENNFGKEIKYFATPYGAYNNSVNENIMKYYYAHRTVDVGYNSKDNFDVTRLKVKNILSSTTLSEVAYWVKKAKEDKTWLILVYHRVANNPRLYDTTPEKFIEHLEIIKNENIPVVTISEALAEIELQIKK